MRNNASDHSHGSRMLDPDLKNISIMQCSFRLEDDQFVQFRSSAPAGRIAFADTFREHFQSPPDELVVCIRRRKGKGLQKDLIALFLDLLRDIIRKKFRGFRPFARRIFEDERKIIADLFHDVPGLLEIFIRFRGEPDYDIR